MSADLSLKEIFGEKSVEEEENRLKRRLEVTEATRANSEKEKNECGNYLIQEILQFFPDTADNVYMQTLNPRGWNVFRSFLLEYQIKSQM